jgi:hypothetical protein
MQKYSVVAGLGYWAGFGRDSFLQKFHHTSRSRHSSLAVRKEPIDMTKIKNTLITTAVLAGLAMIGAVMNTHQTVVQAAGGGPTVTIDSSQLPLPITGSTTVAGTVMATQSGVWNVNINGMPGVLITNPATNPAWVGNVDEPGRTPYSQTIGFDQRNCSQVAATYNCSLQFALPPHNTRLVITDVTGVVYVNPPGVAEIVLNGASGGFNPVIAAPALQAGTFLGQNISKVDAHIRAYVNDNTFPRLFVNATAPVALTNNQGIGGSSISVSGYLVNCATPLVCGPLYP